MYNLVIYYGKETLLTIIPGKNHTTNVIMTLMEPLANMEYDLYTDRFYTSPEVATELLQISTPSLEQYRPTGATCLQL